MAVFSSNVFEQISAFRPKSILDVVPRSAFHEIDDPAYAHIGNGNCYEWKFAIAKFLQPATILEIGVRYGYSLASFIMGSNVVWKVEGWDSEIYVKGSNDIAAAAIRSLPKNVDSTLRRLDSQDVQIVRSYDLIHIDSSHTYHGCLHDLRMCLGMTKAVLVDDTLTCPDDMRAVLTFHAENTDAIKELVHIHSHVGETLILLN